MLAPLRSVVFFFDDAQLQSAVAEHAASLAHHQAAHLIGVYRASEASDRYDGFTRGEGIHDVIVRQMRKQEEQALRVSRRLRELSLRFGLSIEFRVIEDADAAIASQLVHCDMAVLGQPAASANPVALSADRVLMASSAPLLLIPVDWTGDRIGTRIVLAWNGSREARRAINDAMPFITASEWVKVLIVDADRTPARYGADPGVDIAHFLARHGAKVEVQQMQSGDRSVADTIGSFALDAGANLVVLGAYSHRRLGEMLLGGVTRTLLAEPPVPVLASR